MEERASHGRAPVSGDVADEIAALELLDASQTSSSLFRSVLGRATKRNGRNISAVHLSLAQQENLMAHRIAIARFRTLDKLGVAKRDLDLRRLTKDTMLPPDVTARAMLSFGDSD